MDYLCEVCGNKYKTQQALKAHRTLKHGSQHSLELDNSLVVLQRGVNDCMDLINELLALIGGIQDTEGKMLQVLGSIAGILIPEAKEPVKLELRPKK